MSKTLKSVRKSFLNYFSNKKHKVVDSSNLVPSNDPTLMFTNSGMVQFKNVFTGLEKEIIAELLHLRNVLELEVNITILRMLVILLDTTHFLKS